jgi:hypothetical protein
MKRDRSLRRIDDESIFIKNKQIEIVLLNKEIEQMQEEKTKLQKLIFQYQPHLNLLTQVRSCRHTQTRAQNFYFSRVRAQENVCPQLPKLKLIEENIFIFRLSIKLIVFIRLMK